MFREDFETLTPGPSPASGRGEQSEDIRRERGFDTVKRGLLRRRRGLAVGFDADGDLDVLAEDRTGIHHAVPDDSVVLAVEREGGLEAGLLSLRGLYAAQEVDGDGDPLGDAVHGQIAGDLEGVLVLRLDLGAGEGEGGELLDVEEVRGAQVLVAVGVAGVDRGGLD